jgi:hypothetical protein
MHKDTYDEACVAHIGSAATALFDLDSAIDRIAHWLPTQRPIKDFVNHNTLHAVQQHPFHEGVAIAAKVFGARSYLPLADYQARYREGRIAAAAIDWAVARAASDPLQRDALRRSLFETDHTVHYPPVSLANQGLREKWLTHLEVNLDSLTQPVLFRLVANFLDQGISRWTVARNGESFWDCVWRLVEGSFLPLFPFQEPAARAIINESPETAIRTCLARIVGAEELYGQYLLEMLLAHPGWSGMVRVIETEPAAQLERQLISNRTKEALARKKAEGIRIGRPPGTINEVKKLDPHRADIIKMLGKGMSLTSIAQYVECSRPCLYDWLEANGMDTQREATRKAKAGGPPPGNQSTAIWDKIEALHRRFPEDQAVTRGYALRVGICRLIDEGKLSLEEGVRLFDLEKTRMIMERAAENAARKRPRPLTEDEVEPWG